MIAVEILLQPLTFRQLAMEIVMNTLKPPARVIMARIVPLIVPTQGTGWQVITAAVTVRATQKMTGLVIHS